MKLRSNQGTVETSGLADTTNFSIKVNGKAFKILLDGLYSDKVGAVIRELSTNAYDAHIAVGHEKKPFDVTLPTQFDPTFSVRDYGISMTHEQLSRLITTVFESSKDNANNQVGAFGLGSKSPFSLVDAYTITAWKGGEKRSYSAFFNSDGVPSLALLGTEKSSEPQGIEFSMVVNARDVDAFRRRAPQILRWFPTIPNVKNLGSSQITPPQVKLAGNGWMLCTGNDAVSCAQARQGCVVYPINANAVQGISRDLIDLLQTPLIIDFAIGDLDVAASREALGYDESTCKNIIARLTAVLSEVQTTLGKSIIDAPSLWAAGAERIKISELGLPSALRRVLEATKWQNKTDCGTFAMTALLKKAFKDGEEPAVLAWDRYRTNRLNYGDSSKTLYIDATAYRTGRDFSQHYGTSGVEFYFTTESDRPSHESRRLGHKATPGKDIVLFVLKNEADKDKVLAALGGAPEAGWTKDIELPPVPMNVATAKVKKKGTTTQTQVKVYPLTVDPTLKFHAKQKVKIKPEEIVELSGEAYYVITHGGDGYYKDSSGDEKWIRQDSVFEALKYLQDEPTFNKSWPVYMISTIYEKRVEAFGKWTSLFTPAEAMMRQDLAQYLALHASHNLASSVEQNMWFSILQGSSSLRTWASGNPDSNCSKLLEAAKVLGFAPGTPSKRGVNLDKMREVERRASSLAYILGCPDVTKQLSSPKVTQAAEFAQFKDLSDKLTQSYPLVLRLIENSYGSRLTDIIRGPDIVNYIAAMDLMEQTRATQRAKQQAASLKNAA